MEKHSQIKWASSPRHSNLGSARSEPVSLRYTLRCNRQASPDADRRLSFEESHSALATINSTLSVRLPPKGQALISTASESAFTIVMQPKSLSGRSLLGYDKLSRSNRPAGDLAFLPSPCLSNGRVQDPYFVLGMIFQHNSTSTAKL